MPTTPYDAENRTDTEEDAATGAGIGAVVGGAGGLLTGLGIMAIPGVGPVVVAGWLAATAVGAVAGAVAGGAAGGIIGALTDPEFLNEMPTFMRKVFGEAEHWLPRASTSSWSLGRRNPRAIRVGGSLSTSQRF